jgi:hypothetical protein
MIIFFNLLILVSYFAMSLTPEEQVNFESMCDAFYMSGDNKMTKFAHEQLTPLTVGTSGVCCSLN